VGFTRFGRAGEFYDFEFVAGIDRWSGLLTRCSLDRYSYRYSKLLICQATFPAGFSVCSGALLILPFPQVKLSAEPIDEEIAQGVDDVIVDAVFIRQLGQSAVAEAPVMQALERPDQMFALGVDTQSGIPQRRREKRADQFDAIPYVTRSRPGLNTQRL